jgi:hypothetical protein
MRGAEFIRDYSKALRFGGVGVAGRGGVLSCGRGGQEVTKAARRKANAARSERRSKLRLVWAAASRRTPKCPRPAELGR